MNKNQNNTKILLVCDNEADIGKIKLKLAESVKIPCYVWHYRTLGEALDVLKKNKLRVDLIILDLGLTGAANPKEIYKKMGDTAHEIPIIVLTGPGEEEHDLATFVMEAGAADHMVRGQFGRLNDAVEFSLIRYNISIKSAQDAINAPSPSQQIIQDAHDEDVRDAKKKSDKIYDQQCQFISWVTGGYSVENNEKKETE